LVETAVALRSGATSASDLLTAATNRMGATRHLNAFIGGVLPRAIERAEASDERRRVLSGSATPEPRASLSTRDKGASSSSFQPPPGVQNRHLPDEMSEISEISSTDAKTTSRDPQDAQAPFVRSLSLLDGVPIAVKDNFFVPGAPTTAGSKVLQSFVTTDAQEGAFESAVTRRLEKRGAVVFAKTNMDEFGMGSANKHSAFGRAVNPWRLVRRTGGRFSDETDDSETDSSVTDTDAQQVNRAPGGSSGGSAAAVASGVAIAAVGSDTGGSVRLPASYCGLVGVKPTYGRVSRWGLVPYCSSLDCPGFLTRTVADAVVLLSATQGKDACDPVTLPADARVDALAKDVERNADEATRRALRDKSRETSSSSSSSSSSSFEETSAAANAAAESGASGARGFLKSRPGFPLAGWRVGIPAEYFVTELSDEVRRAWTATADVCEQMGASVVSVSLPNTRAALPAYYVIAPAEASSNLARYDGVRYGGDFSFSDEKKREPCGTLSEQSSDDSDSADDDSDSRSSAFEKGATSFRGARFGPEVNRRVLVGTFVSGSRRVARYKEKAMKVRRAVSLEFAEAFKKVDVLLAPTAPTTAPPLFPEAETMDNHGQAYGQIVGSYAADAMTVPASLAGLPAVSLPIGLGLTTGLPVGMQVIAARGNDADALGFAMRLEERINELGDDGGGAGPEAAEDHRDGDPPRSVVGWGERHRAVGVLEATRFEGGVM
jgi:aspartyl-tRNA(Asn)/glutamyl-tRNA(Gln) amidotransferase subunit A